jgi:hypothetical protein
MVRVRVREKDRVDLFDTGAQGLLPEVRRGIDYDKPVVMLY